MILVDTGPWVALFDPKDDAHALAKAALAGLTEPLITTVPVLTEAFHLLDPASRGSRALATFIRRGGAKVFFMSDPTLERAFALMERYSDKGMDLADASLVAAAEALRVTRVFTIDRRDFAAYRVLIGRKLKPFVIVPSAGPGGPSGSLRIRETLQRYRRRGSRSLPETRAP